MYDKLIVVPQRGWIALISAFILAVVHQYLFYGHSFGISYPVFVILFYLYMYTYAGDRLRQGSWFSRLVMVVIILLSCTYGLFANEFFRALNALFIPCLISLHLAYMLSRRRLDWNRPELIIDALDHLFPQTFRHFVTPFAMLKNKASRRMQEGQRATFRKIMLGVLAALPLLFIIIALLTSADRMFNELLGTMPRWILNLSPGEGTFRLIWVIVMGFILFGYLWGFVKPLIYAPPVWQTPLPGTGAVPGVQPPSNAQAAANRPPGPSAGTGVALNTRPQLPGSENGQAAAPIQMQGQTASAIPASPATADMPSRPHPAQQVPSQAQLHHPVRIDPVILGTVLVLINIVYVLFVFLQFSYLFGAPQGNLPDGSTYAEYARSGFMELVMVTALNFVIMLCGLLYAGPAGKGLQRLNNGLLYVLVLCSGVMLYSAFTRLLLYEQAYGYTTVRFLVHAFMIFLGVLLIVAGLRIHFRRLPLARCYIILALAAYVLVNYAGMDRQIAVRNMERYEQSGELDLDYLTGLSADAVPALLKFSREHEVPGLADALHEHWAYLFDEDTDWQSINLSDYLAIRALRQDSQH